MEDQEFIECENKRIAARRLRAMTLARKEKELAESMALLEYLARDLESLRGTRCLAGQAVQLLDALSDFIGKRIEKKGLKEPEGQRE